jgi:acyl-CoA dehydrogenase
MNETLALVEESATRLFAAQFDRATRDAAEHGVWPARAWQACEEAGLTAIVTDGRDDSTLPTLACVLHVAARHAIPLPLAEHALAQDMALAARLVPPPGPLTVGPPLGHSLPGLTRGTDGYRLTGDLSRVPWGRDAAAIVMLAQADDGIRTVICTGAVLARADRNYAGEPRDRMSCDCRVSDSEMGAAGIGWSADDLRLRGALLRAVQIAGATSAVLHMTVDYARQRVQFGRPIGKFQAVQQQIAVLASHAVAAATAAESALSANAAFEIAAAKARAGEAAGIVAEIAHQVHGAMGFTHEHALHRFTRRLWSWRDEFGSEADWAQWIGRLVCRAPGEALWPFLTADQKIIPVDIAWTPQEAPA